MLSSLGFIVTFRSLHETLVVRTVRPSRPYCFRWLLLLWSGWFHNVLAGQRWSATTSSYLYADVIGILLGLFCQPTWLVELFFGLEWARHASRHATHVHTPFAISVFYTLDFRIPPLLLPPNSLQYSLQYFLWIGWRAIRWAGCGSGLGVG